jgi:hypothetical protein
MMYADSKETDSWAPEDEQIVYQIISLLLLRYYPAICLMIMRKSMKNSARIDDALTESRMRLFPDTNR